jgi:hypothetical protein
MELLLGVLSPPAGSAEFSLGRYESKRVRA